MQSPASERYSELGQDSLAPGGVSRSRFDTSRSDALLEASLADTLGGPIVESSTAFLGRVNSTLHQRMGVTVSATSGADWN